MLETLLLLAVLQSPADTVALDVGAAFRRAMEIAPAVVAADLRAQAAFDRVAQADAWPNPSFTVNAENLGRQQRLTGLSGFEGTEGQAVLSADLPFGWERAAEQASARAAATFSGASARIARYEAGMDALTAIGAVLRDRALVTSARQEAETLTEFADVLALQASEGRAAAGDAARAALARGLASTRVARREAALAGSEAELSRRLGYPPDTQLVLDAPVCGSPPGPRTYTPPMAAFPELDLAAAHVDAAQAGITQARGLRAPDFTPQVGLRRVGGLNALYLGIGTTLPLFDRGSRRIDAARAEYQAASEEAAAVEADLLARVVAARRSLRALESAGRGFNEAWFASLEQTVTAAEARYELGEGGLFELLDSRRARLEALDDYSVWQAEWWYARVALERLEGRELDASLICLDPFRGIQ